MRAAVALLLVAAAVGYAGWSILDSGDGKQSEERLGTEQAPAAPLRRSPEERVIRAWLEALNAGEFERAGGFFARGAVVEQIGETRLRTRAAAIAFNRSLPCRGDLTDVDDQGRTVLGAFRLREGRGGRCAAGGFARVRFLIRDGKIREWRQLLETEAPGGPVA
jgi:hypothetical protein